jgi:hypothetical protein
MSGNPDIANPSFMKKQIMDALDSYEDGTRTRICRIEQLFENMTLFNQLRSEILYRQIDNSVGRVSHGVFINELIVILVDTTHFT